MSPIMNRLEIVEKEDMMKNGVYCDTNKLYYVSTIAQEETQILVDWHCNFNFSVTI